ncbi:TDT family transporter [Eubacteriaceae bacterium RF-744-FAT-4]|uniref:TDT family transporter n=1 Tax=Pseudoramibacter porci TaxID=2606631 RepID=A0A7X2NHL1_9FIRM|nr:TDT family transporter [Pseudoramibacter porci]
MWRQNVKRWAGTESLQIEEAARAEGLAAAKAVIGRVPINLSGVMLAAFALGNLLQSFGEGWRMACGIAAAFMLVLLLLKLLLFPKALLADISQPVTAGVAGTFTMGLMFCAVYLTQYFGAGSFGLWLWQTAVGLHAVLMIYYFFRFIRKFKLEQIYTVCFIVYVGFAAAGVTAPVFGYQMSVGTFAFWFGLCAFAVLFFVVTARMIKRPPAEPFKPLTAIYAAPLSLCIVADIQSAASSNVMLLIALLAASSAIYVFALVCALRCLSRPFYPSWAGMTFPFVISANAVKQTTAWVAAAGHPLPLGPVVLAETIAAGCFVVCVAARYMLHIFAGK